MFLRRSLICFYCGRSSNQKKTAGLREWRCGSCEAVNYLDENGNTTDPPAATDDGASSRYAGRGEAITSPELGPLTESVFCATCLKNQYLLSHNLAEYLPETDDPRYPEYEKNLPSYRTRLEERYPPVCSECEPRVRARLRTTGYAAKTDHLRRMAEITKRSRNEIDLSNGKALLLATGAICWWTANLTQILWHALELALLLPIEELGIENSGATSGIGSDFLMNLRSAPLIESILGSIGLVSLVLTCCSIWWNPITGRNSTQRTTGLREFYRLQGILLIARFLAWRLLDKSRAQTMDVRLQTVAHGVACMFNIFVTIVSYRTVQIRLTPQIVFEMGEGALQMGFRPQSLANTPLRKSTFPLEALRPPVPEQTRFSGPPTPPLDESSDDDLTTVATTFDGDAMDIDTPERPAVSWTPRKARSTISETSTIAPSPFRGHLPPAPISQAHRLRNPPNKPTFRKTSDSRQKAFFESMQRKPYESEQLSRNAEINSGSRDIQFAAPQFFADKHQDTGLESLFSGLVSLDDEPSELRKPSSAKQLDAPLRDLSSLVAAWSIIETILIAFAVMDLTVSEMNSPRSKLVRTGALTYILIDSIIHLRDRLSPSRPVWLLSDLLFYASECLAAIGLLSFSHGPQRQTDGHAQSIYDGEIALLWIFVVQKLLETSSQVSGIVRAKSEAKSTNGGLAQAPNVSRR